MLRILLMIMVEILITGCLGKDVNIKYTRDIEEIPELAAWKYLQEVSSNSIKISWPFRVCEYSNGMIISKRGYGESFSLLPDKFHVRVSKTMDSFGYDVIDSSISIFHATSLNFVTTSCDVLHLKES